MHVEYIFSNFSKAFQILLNFLVNPAKRELVFPQKNSGSSAPTFFFSFYPVFIVFYSFQNFRVSLHLFKNILIFQFLVKKFYQSGSDSCSLREIVKQFFSKSKLSVFAKFSGHVSTFLASTIRSFFQVSRFRSPILWVTRIIS